MIIVLITVIMKLLKLKLSILLKLNSVLIYLSIIVSIIFSRIVIKNLLLFLFGMIYFVRISVISLKIIYDRMFIVFLFICFVLVG